MEDVHAAALMPAGPTAPALLISLHDVSPLTLGACQRAWAMLTEAGVRASQLTAFVIPFHESKVRVDEHPETARWLSTLAGQGADLVMHGLTHRMTGRSWTPAGFARAHVFARGQGEFFRCDGAEASRRLEEGAAILRRAGLDAATRAFVPPAWLLSPAAAAAVEAVGFDFVERFDGIAVSGQRDRRLARRVIGWGSLSELEARATAIYAGWQARRAVVDTRLAVHPVDVDRPSQRRAVTRALARLLSRMRPLRYSDFLAAA
jgi:predicted deacetylase